MPQKLSTSINSKGLKLVQWTFLAKADNMSTKYTYADVKYADEKSFPEEHIWHIEWCDSTAFV